jgi:4-amino-4-deoxy-L-arabinose transferase-like glycosyltransferase
MSGAMLTRRDAVIWAAAFVFVSALLVITHFASDDPDSALYAELSARLAELPPSEWIAPQWWGQWNSEGWFREHPAGVFLLPTALGAIGIPVIQASYIVGIGAGLVCLLTIGRIVTRLTSPADGRAVLVLLQLMPVAFLFRIRANHEYPMLACLVATIVGLDGVRRSWSWTALVAASLTAAVLVKGVFVVMILIAASLWIAINPTRQAGSIVRPVVAGLVSASVVAAVAYLYDGVYMSATGERFWWPYWQRQLGPLDIATPFDGASTLLSHAFFYLSRLMWHPAPWSLAVLVALWQHRRSMREWWKASAGMERRGLMFALLFTIGAVGILLPSSRFAERYAFSATYAVAAAGAVLAYRGWPWLRGAVQRWDARVPALPAVLWLLLMLARLAIGPFLPRVS